MTPSAPYTAPVPAPLEAVAIHSEPSLLEMGFPGGSVAENPPAAAGDVGLIPGSDRFCEKEMTTHSRILAWEIPWTEEPQGLQSMGLQQSGT